MSSARTVSKANPAIGKAIDTPNPTKTAPWQRGSSLGIGGASWDLMAALPILDQIGIRSTVDWSTTDLSLKLRFACGTPELLQAVEPIISYGAKLDFEN